MADEPSVRARQVQLGARASAIRALDRTQSEGRDGHEDRNQDTLREGDGGQMDLVEELRGSTYMKTRDRYKHGAATFLLHLYNSGDDALTAPFASQMEANLAMVRPRNGTSDEAMIYSLLPSYCEEPIEPLHWDLLTPEKILEPIWSWKDDFKKLSESRLSSYRAALHLLFKDFGKTDTWLKLSPTVNQVLNGWKRRRVRLQKKRGLSVEKGMAELPFKVYAELCKRIACDKLYGAFGWTYATMLWNLMGRSDNISHISVNHIKCKDDHLLIYYAQQKTDQDGKLSKYPRAVYANPLYPWTCAITALGVYLIVTNTRVGNSDGSLPLFHGSQDECARRFRVGLHAKAKEIANVLEENGMTIQSVGTHSFRKGAATYASAGGTACPSSSAISLRAGWTQPGVEDTYRRYDSAGDEHVGRVLTGLPMNGEELAILPPIFMPKTHEDEAFIDECCKSTMDVTQVNPGVARRCLASVVFHIVKLREGLPHDHKLWADRTINNKQAMERLQSLIFSGFQDNSLAMEANLCATGVPPHCALLRSMRVVKDQVAKLIPGVDEQLSQLPKLFRDALDEAIADGKIEGAPLTACNLERTVLRLLEESGLKDVPRLLLEGNTVPTGTVERPTNLADFGLQAHKTLPSDFYVPNMTLQKSWYHWMLGDAASGHRPWRLIQLSELKDKKARERLRRFRKIMLAVQESLQDNWKEASTFDEVEKQFDSVKAAFQFPSKAGHKRRYGELSWDTVLRHKYKQTRSS